jgi:sugar phosphate isomerase/epimerase
MNTQISLNQATTRGYPLGETIRVARAAGIEHLGLWIEPAEEIGIPAAKRLIADHGMTVTSICRVGFVADKTGEALDAALDSTRRAIDLSVDMGGPMVTFIAGGLATGEKSLRDAAGRVHDALEQLVPYALQAGVVLALEPIHPLFAADRSVVATVDQAVDLIDDLPSEAVGVLIDSYATWWDPQLESALLRAGTRIAGFQVSDFALPLPAENMNGRLMMGEGVIDFRAMLAMVRDAGFQGPVEVEIFNDALWAQPLDQIIDRTVVAFAEHVAVDEVTL